MKYITKVVSRLFIWDFIANIQKTFGMNLTSYEKMIEKGIKQIEEEMKKRNLKFKWYRFEKSELTNGAMAITIYGEEE